LPSLMTKPASCKSALALRSESHISLTQTQRLSFT
jgi:hypothetical protein